MIRIKIYIKINIKIYFNKCYLVHIHDIHTLRLLSFSKGNENNVITDYSFII